MHEALRNILQYLTPEILAWESGNIREVRPLGSALCLPDGREWYAFGFTRNAYDGSLSLLMASSQREYGEWERANSPVAIRFGAQRYLIDGTGYEMFDGSNDQLFRLSLLLRDRPPMPDWLRSTPLSRLLMVDARVDRAPERIPSGPAELLLRDGRGWDLTAPRAELRTM